MFEKAEVEAITLLEQAVMRIGKEMANDLKQILSYPQELMKHIKQLQKQAMNGIQPLTQELKDNLINDVAKDIQKAGRDSAYNLHLNQSKLTRDSEEKFCMRTEIRHWGPI